MLDSIFATKTHMTQAWLKNGKRLAVTKCRVEDNIILNKQPQNIFEVGYKQKKFKNITKPLREKIKKSGFSFGVTQIKGIEADEDHKVGDIISLTEVLEVGDVVKVQGKSKGRGFAGGMKRHNFHGGPATHGQSDRARAIGSIGAGTDPGRVWKGKKMPGHYGDDTRTVTNLVVVFIDEKIKEVWLNGPIPGFYSGTVKITKTGGKKDLELDLGLLGLVADDEKEEKGSESKVEGEEVKEEAKK
jgi:large subunit ribosomal protein L3